MNEEGRLEPAEGEGQSFVGGALHWCREAVGPPAAEPSPVASALGLCRAEAAEARHPAESWLWE